MTFELIDLGASRSLPDGDPLRDRASSGAPVVLLAGGDAPARARRLRELDGARPVLVELGTECLGYHVGEGATAPRHVLGYARFRFGALPATPLVELVRRPDTDPQALDAARAALEAAGLDVAVCADVPGRLVDSLLRPYLNAALASVDEGLAAPADLDQALRLGLGFPRGPFELAEAGGLAAHHDITHELHAMLGAPEFAPARRARVEAMRVRDGLHKSDGGPTP